MKEDQCQPHENSWTACQSYQVVNWVKYKPGLAGIQIPFGGTRFDFVYVSIIECILLLLETPTYIKTNLVAPKGIYSPSNLTLVLTLLTSWDDWGAC